MWWTVVWTSLPKSVFRAPLYQGRYRAYNTDEDVVLVFIEEGIHIITLLCSEVLTCDVFA